MALMTQTLWTVISVHCIGCDRAVSRVTVREDRKDDLGAAVASARGQHYTAHGRQWGHYPQRLHRQVMTWDELQKLD